MVNETTFVNPEMPLVIRDDVRKWKSAFVGVFDHPFHTVSKSGGSLMVGVVDNERRVINITFGPNDR